MPETKINNSKPIIAIVGRPNTGKSTLFNRLIGFRKAIESEFEGTTRDRLFHHCNFGNYETILVDTGGLEFDDQVSIEEDVQIQARLAIEDADLILFLVSAKDLLTSRDYEAADLLRRSGKEVILAANKCDTAVSADFMMQFYELGFGEPIAISAIHNTGLSHLENNLKDRLKVMGFPTGAQQPKIDSNEIRLAFAGRPNTGKSSLVNAFFAEPKVIVSDISGTTRDAIDTHFTYNEHDFVFIDTAGIRRSGKRQKRLEKYSVMRSLRAIENSDITLLVLDFEEGVSKQDCHVSEAILEAHSGLIIVVNKCDLMEEKEEDRDKFIYQLKTKMSFLSWAPVVFVSAKTKKNVAKILDLAAKIKEQRQMRIPTSQLNDFIADCVRRNVPTGTKIKKPKILYASQVSVAPPHFVLYVNDVSAFHFSYRRYLENQLRERFGFEGTGIRIDIKDKGGMVDEGKGKRRRKK